jgi:hypothetical protein
MDLSTCIKSNNGLVYCFDRDSRHWVSFRTTEIEDASQLPADVVMALTERVLKNETNTGELDK